MLLIESQTVELWSDTMKGSINGAMMRPDDSQSRSCLVCESV